MNLRQVRKKTKSIRNVKKITKALQMVSAVKMKKSQQAEVNGRPYRDTLNSIIERILPSVETSRRDVSTKINLMQPVDKGIDKKLVVLISSNKGLCGAFHVNLDRFILRANISFSTTDFVTMGSKGLKFITGMGGEILADFSKTKFLNEVSAVFSFALEKFRLGNYSLVSILYNKYISAFNSEPVEETLLPFQWEKEEIEKKALNLEYLIEPAINEIIEPLLKNYLEEKIRGAIISSEAVEHASRMLAMKNATDNATDIIYNLTQVGNKLRQEKITNELLDMITAKESVEN